MGVLGVVIVRVLAHRAATDTSRLEADFAHMDERLRSIAKQVAALDDAKHDIGVYDLPGRIDAQLPADITLFADARHSIAPPGESMPSPTS